MTISLDPADGRSLLARRAADRRVTAFGMALAAGYLALTVLSVLAPPALRMGAWLPLHLLLAGAAATAVAGVMPFFAAGVASVPPAATPIRVAGVAGVAVGAGLVVLVRLRLAPGRRADYEALLRERLVPWEKETRIAAGSDSGRFLLSDGFDFFRILGIENLAAWQRYVEAAREAPFASELDGWIAESRQVILAPVRELFVR